MQDGFQAKRIPHQAAETNECWNFNELSLYKNDLSRAQGFRNIKSFFFRFFSFLKKQALKLPPLQLCLVSFSTKHNVNHQPLSKINKMFLHITRDRKFAASSQSGRRDVQICPSSLKVLPMWEWSLWQSTDLTQISAISSNSEMISTLRSHSTYWPACLSQFSIHICRTSRKNSFPWICTFFVNPGITLSLGPPGPSFRIWF